MKYKIEPEIKEAEAPENQTAKKETRELFYINKYGNKVFGGV